MQSGFYDTKSKCKICFFIELVLYKIRILIAILFSRFKILKMSTQILSVVFKIGKLICWIGSLFVKWITQGRYIVSSGVIVRFG